jgi:hypothetical protein
LILIPYLLGSTKALFLSEQSHGTKDFGSSNAYWIQQIGQNRPELELKINGEKFKGLMDTGAEFSVISLTHWPAAWPMQPTVTQLWYWTKSISLPKEKLEAAHQLVQEQLQEGHIEPTSAPWNTPIFVIKKKSGKWRLLQDLRAINGAT